MNDTETISVSHSSLRSWQLFRLPFTRQILDLIKCTMWLSCEAVQKISTNMLCCCYFCCCCQTWWYNNIKIHYTILMYDATGQRRTHIPFRCAYIQSKTAYVYRLCMVQSHIQCASQKRDDLCKKTQEMLIHSLYRWFNTLFNPHTKHILWVSSVKKRPLRLKKGKRQTKNDEMCMCMLCECLSVCLSVDVLNW